MSSNPLSYEGLKTVIQYMEPNLRYYVSGICPSIRSVEKLIPPKFDTLEFDTVRTKVNQTTYRLGMYRHYHIDEQAPQHHKKMNARGGITNDLNDDGFEFYSLIGDVTPGDVDIPCHGSEEAPWLYYKVLDNHKYRFESHIKIYKKAVTMKLEQSPDLSMARGEGEAIILDSIRDQQDERKLLAKILPLTVEKLREEIDYFQACLIPYRCGYNTPLPFTPLIQLTIESARGTLVYRHAHTLNLQQAMKKLNTALFGGRLCVQRSRALNIMQSRFVLRMPEGVRLRIQELRTTGYADLNYEALKLIVEESSYPLNSLTLTILSLDEIRKPILDSAKSLALRPERKYYDSWLPILRLLKNETIYVDCLLRPFPIEDQISLVEQWLNEDKEVGTSLSYDIKGLDVVTELLSQISLQLNGIRQMNNMVVMPMNNGNRLEVSYISIEQPDSQDKQQKFRVEMKVVAAEEFS